MGDIINDGARHTLAQSKVDAGRVLQKSGNAKAGALSDLARFSASLGNQRKMDAAGKQIDSITENTARNLDAAVYGHFEGRLQAAEELGANVNSAAAAGVGGSSVDMFNDTLKANEAAKLEQQDRAVNTDNIAAGQAKGIALTDTVATLDNNRYNANLDYTQFVDDKKMGTFTKLSALSTAAAATYFGGPEAGKAVLDVFSANQRARNGDIAGADKLLGSALNEGVAGVKTYRDGAPGGQAWGKGAWDSAKDIMSGVKLKG